MLVNKKFTHSEKIKEQIDKYRMESDSVAMYVNEYEYIPSYRCSYSLKAIYDEYKTYSVDSGYKAVSIRTFADRLRMIGFVTERRAAGNIIYADKK